MDNAARNWDERNYEMMTEDDRYYTVKGIRFERDKKYTVEDFYALPDQVKVELIDGVFYDMAQPTSAHQGIVRELLTNINNYIHSKGGSCQVFPAPFGVQLDEDDKSVVEPDISVICDPNKISERGCTGAPDWVIEVVSPSNPGHDYITKLLKYNKAGVREYWIVDPIKSSITVYKMDGKDFDMTSYTFRDNIKVGIYDDFEIDFAPINDML